MKKLLTYMLSILLVLSFAPNVNAIAPQITNIPDQTIDEGQTFETIKLDDFVSDVEDADNVLSWIAEDQSELAVSISNRIATITTPSADWNGQETITFRVTDSESLEDEDTVTFKVNPSADIPNLASIGNKEVLEEFTLEFTVSATDPDTAYGDVLTYSMTLPEDSSLEGKSIDFNANTQTFTWTPTDEDLGLYKEIEFKVRDSQGNEDSEKISIRVFSGFCDLEDQTNIEITAIDFDDEDYLPTDEVSVDVDVKAKEDLEDVKVKILLYNLNSNEKIDDWEADDKEDINDGDEETFSIDFKIPNDKDIGANDKYLLIAIADADDTDNNNQCIYDTEGITIERETHDVYAKELSVIPSTVKPGETVNIAINLENRGTDDEDDVYVRVRSPALGWDERSQNYDLDKYSKSDNDAIIRFSLKVPSNAETKTYQPQVLIYFDEGDETKTEFVDVNVENGQTSTQAAQLSVTSDTSIKTSDKEVNLHLTIMNSEDADLNAMFDVAPGNWGQPIVGQLAPLHSGANNFYPTLKLNEDITPGIKSAIVTVRPSTGNAFEEKQFTLNFNIEEAEESKLSDFSSSSVFWIIGDIVLVIVALFFIKSIFFGRKKEEE